MTLNIITSHRNGLILASDRRTLNRTIHPELNFNHHIGIFYDGFQKVNVLKSPHNFVGFIMFGNGAVEIDLLIEEFEQLLPNKRLSILEYAQNLRDFLIEKIIENKYPDHINVASHSSHIAVAGYDESQNFCKVFKFCPEKNSIPEDLINGKEKSVSGGDTRYIQIGNNFYLQKLLEDLRQKHFNLSKIGLKLTRNEAQLVNNLLRRGNIQPFITFPMLIDLAKTIIEQTAYEQVRRDEFPMVGDTVDILTITQKEGAKFVIHNVEQEGYLKLVDTNKNHIFLKCCNKEIYFQIDFNEEKPLSRGFIRYPSDGIYTCPICNQEYDLDPLLEILTKEFSDSEEES